MVWGNIQKGVAVSGLEKKFAVFSVLVDGQYVPVINTITPSLCAKGIYRIIDFPTYSIEIDFSNPNLSINTMTEITEEVEKECPVGKHFGNEGIGEGVVWSCSYFEGGFLNFKVKGEKHSSSKVKKLASVDTEKVANIQKFVDYAVTESRLNQAVEQVFTINSQTPDIKGMGDFIRWVVNDVVKEI